MQEEAVKDLISAVLVLAIEDLSVPVPHGRSLHFQQRRAAIKRQRASAVQFITSPWGRSLLAYNNVVELPAELTEKIANARKILGKKY